MISIFRFFVRKIRDIIRKNRASPLVEEGLLIGLAILIFIVIVTIVGQIIDWVNNLSQELPS